jgi:hypothetical protein
MAKQAEAERERRAKVSMPKANFSSAEADRSGCFDGNPANVLTASLLQTLNQIASENNSTTVFPIPIDLFKPF